MKRLLVGYDGSDPAREAARMAARIAAQLGAGLTVFTVGQITPLVASLTGVLGPLVDEKLFRTTAEAGAETVRALGVEPEVRVELGDPADRILQAVDREGYDLVVVGHRGVGGIAGLILGSVAKRLAETAPCPVLVVRGTSPAAFRKLLVGIDGSEQAQRAAEVATALAGPSGAEVTLLYALDPTMLAAVSDDAARRQLRLVLEKTGRDALEKAAQVCERAGVARRTVLAEGRPVEVICKRARLRGYDLVALGRRGMTGLARFTLGSVSDEVLRQVGRPVLLVGERAKRAPLG